MRAFNNLDFESPINLLAEEEKRVRMPVYFVYDADGVLCLVTFIKEKANNKAQEEKGYVKTESMILCD